jgi:flagellar biosynthesis protein FliR
MESAGLGVHYQLFDEPYTTYISRNLLCLFIEELMYSFVTAFAKISVLSFFWRIFQRSSIRLPIKIMASLVVAWLLARVCELSRQAIWND